MLLLVPFVHHHERKLLTVNNGKGDAHSGTPWSKITLFLPKNGLEKILDTRELSSFCLNRFCDLCHNLDILIQNWEILIKVVKTNRKCFLVFQTCYEMERYLKDEPKLHTYKNKLPAELDTAPWNLFRAPPISWTATTCTTTTQYEPQIKMEVSLFSNY